MSRLERERKQIALERWPNLREFIATEFADDFFQAFDLINRLLLEKVQHLRVEHMKMLAIECTDFATYFSGRYDDVYMLLDGLGAKMPFGKIPYEGGRPQGTVRIRALCSELVRLIRKTDLGWKP